MVERQNADALLGTKVPVSAIGLSLDLHLSVPKLETFYMTVHALHHGGHNKRISIKNRT